MQINTMGLVLRAVRVGEADQILTADAVQSDIPLVSQLYGGYFYIGIHTIFRCILSANLTVIP